jgi:hypothetical protein
LDSSRLTGSSIFALRYLDSLRTSYKVGIEVKKVDSTYNIAHMMIMALPAYTHRILIQNAGMKLLHEIVYL